MANLQVKGIDERLYDDLKRLAANDNRSVSQEVVTILRDHLAKNAALQRTRTPGQVLLSLAGSWEDERPAAAILRDLRRARRPSKKLRRGW